MASNMEKAIILMVTTNMKQYEIAKELGVSQVTISNYKKHKNYQKIKSKMQEEFLSDLAPKALRTMEELLNAKSEYVRLSAASDILDRTGYKATDKLEVQSDNVVIIDDVK